MYSGSDRHNATQVIESDSAASVGAPIRVPVSSNAIIVLQSVGERKQTGTGTFSFRVEGLRYNWYERPFIGMKVGAYYLTVTVIMVTFFCLFWPCLLGLIMFALWAAGSAAFTAISAAVSAVFGVVASLFTSFISVFCPCIPLGNCAAVCCYYRRKNKNSPGAKKKTARKVNRNFGKSNAKEGVMTLSPTGGKGKGKIPQRLGQASSGKK